MFHQDMQDGDRIEALIIEALREILAHEDPQRFLHWALVRIPDALSLNEPGLTLDESRRVATLLAAAIWNATPLPGQDFQQHALLFNPGDPCPCGSSEPFHACCGRSDELPDLSSDVIWELLLAELPERAIQRALHLAAMPRQLLPKVAERWLDLDRPGRAIALLEPLFDPDQSDDGRRELALEVLCDAYDRLDHWKKKKAFLQRMTVCEERGLRGAAWRRISAGHLDEGDFAAAHEAFVQALRQSPDDPALAFLEIALLSAEHRDGEARRRAELWRYRLSRQGIEDADILAFLAAASDNPQEALMASQAQNLDPAIVALYEWTQQLATRPLPDYRPTPRPSAQRDEATQQLKLFEANDVSSRGHPVEQPGPGSRLSAGRTLARLEDQWHRVFPAVKPYSMQLTLLDDGDIWAADDDWVAFLFRHPETADSLDILDDLATAVASHPESTLPWVARALLPPLLARAQAILERAIPREDPHTIPWACEQNRPALRLLFRHYLYQMEAGDPAATARALEDLLRLNPRDNHGVRADLMNHYLRDRQDDKALALARRFPGDRLADLLYGEVLALYRLGESERAARALNQAIGQLPRIPAYLTRQRIKAPKRSRWPASPSGEDQAWSYREAMRDVWAAEPGIMAWLRRMTA